MMSRRKRMMEELDRDIRDHIERETQDNIDRGMSPEEARYAALRKFGNIRRAKEDTRAVWSFVWLEQLLQDVRFGARMLRKSPGFTAVAILTVALGIGANTAIFTLVDAVMLESLPVSQPEQLVVPRWSAHNSPNNIDIGSYGDCERPPKDFTGARGCSFSAPLLAQLRGETELFSDVAAFAGPASVDVSGNGTASMASADLVSGNYFQTLGVRPAIGRTIAPDDDRPGAAPTAVLNYAYWRTAFGGTPGAIGRTVHLNGVDFEVIGVANPDFTRLTPGKSVDLWVPLATTHVLGLRWGDSTNGHDERNWWLTLIARLAPETSRASAQAAIEVLYRNDTMAIPEPLFKKEDDPRVLLMSAQEGLAGFRTQLRDPLRLLMTAVVIVLVITCANLGGLMLARAASRQREVAVRLTLGAGRSRVVRQLLTESVLLSAIGAAFGILLAVWSAQALAAFFMANSYSTMLLDLHLDTKVLAFTSGIALLAGIAFGLAPAIFGSRVNLSPALKETSGGIGASHPSGRRFALGSSLVIAQVALSVVMMIGAGLLVRTLEKLRSIPAGFDADDLVLFTLSPDLAGYKAPAVSRLYEQLSAKLAALPGVSSVTYSSDALLDGSLWSSGIKLPGMSPKDYIDSQMLAIGPDYFSTMRIPVLSGRGFTHADMVAARKLAIVNEACARKFPRGVNPIGQMLDNNDEKREVVGVVGNTKYADMRKPSDTPTVYIPAQDGDATFALRSTLPAAALGASIKRIVYETDENLPVVNVRTQSAAIDRLLFNERLVARLSSLFGALALLLTCLGLYGLLAFEVARRTREIGIRMALGAQTRDVLRGVLLRGLALAATGALVGIIVALGVTRYIESMLYGVKPLDALTFVCVPALLIVVALAACWIPARRAMRVDPMVALRYE